MSLVTTDAVVLHAFAYLESSRILRVLTRDAGVQAVLGKGARRSQRRFGTSLDLFAEGQASYYTKPGRDLHTLASFDVSRARIALGLDIGRFTAASALAELVLRVARDDAQPALYDAFIAALDAIAAAPPADTRSAGLAGAWRVVAELGFTPAVDACAECHAPIPPDRPARFSHPAGGALCDACGRFAPATRLLPAPARAALRAWLAPHAAGDPAPNLVPLDDASARAHQRLLREFLREHVDDGRPLRAFEAWEGDAWNGGGAAPAGAEAP